MIFNLQIINTKDKPREKRNLFGNGFDGDGAGFDDDDDEVREHGYFLLVRETKWRGYG